MAFDCRADRLGVARDDESAHGRGLPPALGPKERGEDAHFAIE